MKFKLFGLVAWIVLLGVPRVEATPITYNVDIVGTLWGSIVGTITTDGTIGPLAAGNITNWDLTVVGGEFIPPSTIRTFTGQVIGPPSGTTSYVGHDTPLGVLVGSATTLTFSFSDATPGIFEIQTLQGCCTLTAFSFQDAGNVDLAGGEIFVDADGVVVNLCCAAPSDVVGTAGISSTPLPAALPLFTTGLGGLGLLGWRRKRSLRKTKTTNQNLEGPLRGGLFVCSVEQQCRLMAQS